MTPGELFQQDKLTEAIEAALGTVKKSPTDGGARYLLSELLCLAGDLERADKQLDTIGTQNPQSSMRVSLFRQLIRAETARRQFFKEGRLPEFLTEANPQMRLHLDAVVALKQGQSEEAAKLLEEAEAGRTKLKGTCNGEAFDDFRDLDDAAGGWFEVLTSTGKYYLVSMDTVRGLEFQKPERPLDLLWRQVRMSVENGPDGEVYIPAIYVSTYDQPSDELRLGRNTEWLGEQAPVLGVGQRTFLVGDGTKGIGELTSVAFEEPGE